MKATIQFLLLSMLLCLGVVAQAATRYHGEWEIARGSRGMMALEVFDDGRIQGSCTDSGWEKMTGEKRTGKVTGKLYKENGTMTIKWSTGQTMEFRGRIRNKGDYFDFNGDRYVNGKRDPDTWIRTHLGLGGWGGNDPSGTWDGPFAYGPYKGTAHVQVKSNGTFSGHMYGNKGQDWKVTGRLNTDRQTLVITVDSGASKQEYRGVYTKLGDGRVRISFQRPEGEFSATLTRRM
jgi:hypothetical protein